MFAKSVSWIDEESLEAEVTVSDNHIDVLCFSQPFKKSIGEILSEPIYCLNLENVFLSEEKNSYIKKNNSSFGYSIRGELINKEEQLVRLGDIILCLEDGYIPNDIAVHHFIEFDVSRLNLY